MNISVIGTSIFAGAVRSVLENDQWHIEGDSSSMALVNSERDTFISLLGEEDLGEALARASEGQMTYLKVSDPSVDKAYVIPSCYSMMVGDNMRMYGFV